MPNKVNMLNKLYGETQFLELNGESLCDLPLKEVIAKTQTYVLQYKTELAETLSRLSEQEKKVYLTLANLGWKNPPYIYFTMSDINFHCRRGEDDIKTTEENVENLITMGVVVAGTAEPQVNPQTLELIKVSLSYVGYRIRDPLVSLYLYYESNKQLPHWLKQWLQASSPKIELSHQEQELIARIPESGYIMAPTSRKLTRVRDKWYWVTSEKNRKDPDAGMEQMMYILPDSQQEISENLLKKNLLVVHSHHYGMPIHIPNPDHF